MEASVLMVTLVAKAAVDTAVVHNLMQLAVAMGSTAVPKDTPVMTIKEPVLEVLPSFPYHHPQHASHHRSCGHLLISAHHRSSGHLVISSEWNTISTKTIEHYLWAWGTIVLAIHWE